jgi:transposase
MERPAEGAAADDASFVAQVRQMYERDAMSTRRIAEQLGVGRRAVAAALRSAGVAVSPRGAGRPRPTRHVDPDDLEERLRQLYAGDRMTRREASEKLGLSEGLVRTRLAEFAIPTRSRGNWNREDRVEIAVEKVLALYQDRGLSAQRAAELLGVSRGVFLRTAHEQGVRVRPGAATRHESDSIELISALYDDPSVRATLHRHDVPVVPQPGPIWQRFPEPVVLTTELCTELYIGAGLSTMQIEMVTGQPASRIRYLLQRAGVTLRPSGGRSPFRVRWDARHASI